MITNFTDQALKDPADDKLGRASFAEAIANAIFYMEADSGIVFALYGEWGSGKTTTLNFIQHYINQLATEDDRPILIEFNPWWFADRDQLIIQFFSSLKNNILKAPDTGKRLERLGDALEAFSLALSTLSMIPEPLTSITAKGASKVLKSAGASVKKIGGVMQADIHAIRDNIVDGIRKLNKKIIIIIDDIDRLPGEEIRTILRLVNAVANFPNTIYVLSFDRDRVVEVLDGAHSDYGEQFLDKIIQVAHEMPLPSKLSSLNLLSEGVDEIIKDAPDDLANEYYLRNVYSTGVIPFIKTPRQRVRYLNVLSISYPQVNEHVNVADYLAITAIQVFCPKFYSALRDNMALFCWMPPQTPEEALFDNNRRKEERDKQRTALINSTIKDERNRIIVKKTLSLLFPEMGGADELRWSKERRVANHEVFPTYFRMSVEVGEITNPELKSYLSIATDQKGFEGILIRLANEKNPTTGYSRFYHLLSRLEEYTSKDIPEDNVETIIRALYNVGDKCLKQNDESAGIMQLFGSDLMITRVLHQLGQRIKNLDKRFAIIKKAIEDAGSVYIVAYDVALMAQEQGELDAQPSREEDFFITREQLPELKKIVVEKIENAANKGILFQLPHILSLLYRWKDWGENAHAEKFVISHVSKDQEFVAFLNLFKREQINADAHARPQSSKMLFDTKTMSDFLDIDNAYNRCKRILKEKPQWLNAKFKQTIELFIKAKENPIPLGFSIDEVD
jgi:predicted KAP-like P-loop ATPase